MMSRHLVAYIAPNLAQAVSSFGTVAVLTRLLSEADYGRFALVFAATTFIHYVFLTWMEASAARFYAEADERGEKPNHFKTLVSSLLASSALFAVAAVFVIAVWPGDQAMKLALAAGFSGVVVRAALRISLETRRMAREARRFAVVDSAHTLLAFALGIGLVAFFGMGPEGVFIGMAVAAALVLTIEGPALLLAARGGRAEPERAMRYLAFGAPLSGALILNLALASGDRFLIAGFLGEAAVGAYAAGYQVAARVIDMIFLWGATAVTPLLVAAWERGGPEEAARTAYHGYLVRLGMGAPAAVGVAMLATPLCTLLIGEQLRADAARIVPWIALASVLFGMCDYFGEAFMLAKKALQRALLMMIPTALGLALNVILLPRMGIMGAVAATVTAYATCLVLMAVVGRRHMKLPIPVLDTVKIALACAIMAGAVHLTPGTGRVLDLLVKPPVGALVYALAILAFDVGGARAKLAERLGRGAAPAPTSPAEPPAR